jgi:3-phenylpropionate/cinnamic acid dioxygenase small subunit
MTDAPSDREQITDVLVRYATGIDARSWTLFRSCFTPDVRADYGEIGAWTDVDGITEFMAATHEGMVATKHMISNVTIEVQGDAASVVSYVHAVLVLAEDPPTWVDAVGHYVDRFVRTTGGWRIGERTYHMTRLLRSEKAVV